MILLLSLLAQLASASQLLTTIHIDREVPMGMFSLLQAEIDARAEQQYALMVQDRPKSVVVRIVGTRDGKTYFQQEVKEGAPAEWTLTPQDPRLAQAVKGMGLEMKLNGRLEKKTGLKLAVRAAPVMLLEPNPVEMEFKKSANRWTGGRAKLTLAFQRASLVLR